MDHAGEHYASCSDDGRVVVTGLYSDDNGVNFNMGRAGAVHRLRPHLLAHQLGAQVHDGDKLVMHEKVIFGQYKQYFTFHKRFAHHQHDIEVDVLIDHHGGRHQRRPFEKEQIDNEEL